MEGAALFAGFETVTGIFGAFKQSDLNKQRVQLGYEDSLEKIRRRKFTQEQILGEAKAFSQAAGVRHTGGSTAQGVIDSMSAEFKKELDWMKRYAVTARNLGVKQAKADFSSNLIGAVVGGAQSYAGSKG